MPLKGDGTILVAVVTSLLGPNGRRKTIIIMNGILLIG